MARIEEEPASPCRRQCQLSAQRVCTGCGRTVDEISGWRAMSIEQKQQCIDDAPTRLDVMDEMMME